MATDRIEVAIIEDQREIRDGLALLIDGTPGGCATDTPTSPP